MSKVELEPLEHDSQVALMEWWAHFCRLVWVDERLFYAVPNAGAGGSKGQAGKMKAEGVRPGIPDLNLDVPRNGYHGLRIEMKRRGRGPEKHQREVIALLQEQGYFVCVCYSVDEAMRVVMGYLGHRKNG